jgi:hypothetical protein
VFDAATSSRVASHASGLGEMIRRQPLPNEAMHHRRRFGGSQWTKRSGTVHAAIETGDFTAAPGVDDATSRRGRVEPPRSVTEERRAYLRLGGDPSPVRCAQCTLDATSAWRSPDDACFSRPCSEARSARIV